MSHHIELRRLSLHVMARTSEHRYMPCHVVGCRFLTTSNAGLKNHLRIHAPELRARHRREQAHREPDVNWNADNTLDDNWNDDTNSNLHEDNDNDNDDAEERRNPSMPQRDANRNAPEDIQYHPIINGVCILIDYACHCIDVDYILGRCYDVLGNPLSPGAPPPPWEERSPSNYSPFSLRESFLLADLLFRRAQMSAGNIDDLMEYITCLVPPDRDPPFSDSRDLYETIDAAKLGQVPWHSFTLSYQPKEGENISNVPWKSKTFEVLVS